MCVLIRAALVLLLCCNLASGDAVSKYYKIIENPPQLPSVCNFSVSGNLSVSMNPSPKFCCNNVTKCISVAVASLGVADPAVCDETCQQIHNFLRLLAVTNKLQISSITMSFVATGSQLCGVPLWPCTIVLAQGRKQDHF